MSQLNCIIIDNDELDRLMVISLLKRFSQIKIMGVFNSAESALNYLESHRPDIIFLDIDMPGQNGLELRQKFQDIPVCIFITSHPEYAVESYNLDTLDFLVKPLKLERFEKTILRIVEYMELKTKASLFESSIGGDMIFIKEGHNKIKIKLHEIMYLEAMKDYTLLVTEQKRHCILSNLGNLLNSEHFKSFVRVHRSFAVQKQRINKITATNIVMDNSTLLPVGRSFKENLILLM